MLGSGNSAGDIVVVIDKDSGCEHAQKTVRKKSPIWVILKLYHYISLLLK